MKKSLLLLALIVGVCRLNACGGGGGLTQTDVATHFSVAGPPNATAGTVFSLTVSALDASNKVVATYSGTAHFTSSDGQALLPGNSTLTNGTVTFTAVTLNTTGNQTVTATDTVNPSITGTSQSITVSPATAPVPFINQPLSPGAVIPGGSSFTLTVNGTGFVSGSVVHWDGSARATNFFSSSKLTAIVLATDVATFNSASITVVNPAPGGGTSNVVFFEITRPTSSVAMSTPSEFTLGNSSRLVAAGDFNGDGKLDLVVANSADNNVSVFLGKGDGTFQPAVNYSVGSSPFSAATGDFNGDGKLDLVVSNSADNNVSVLLGRGDGTFLAALNYGAGTNPTSVVVGDFNGDGKLDLATANGGSNDVSVLLGNGDGTFQSAVNYGAGAQAHSLAVGDFNGDGSLDLAVANYGANNISVLLGNGDGTFRVAVEYNAQTQPISVAVGDFNGDGKLDLAVPDLGQDTVSVFLGNGDGTFQPAVTYNTGSGPSSVSVGDFNGDGSLDLAMPSLRSGVSVLLGNGDGTFQPAVNFSDASNDFGTDSVAVGDFNRDGRLDMAIANSTISKISVLLQPGLVSGPGAILSSTSLTFATQPIGTISQPQAVVLNNYGSATLTISSIAASNNFNQTDDCGPSLSAGANCTISITFTPTQQDNMSGTLSVTDNAPDSPQTVTLKGAGTIVKVVPTSMLFGCHPGISCPPRPQTATVTNIGSTPVTITSIAIAAIPGTGPFSQTNTCPMSLGAGQSCTITVRVHSPPTYGSGHVLISDNGGASPQTISLSYVEF
jgi:hypothetical protein